MTRRALALVVMGALGVAIPAMARAALPSPRRLPAAPPRSAGASPGPKDPASSQEPIVQSYLAAAADINEAQIHLAKAFGLKGIVERLLMEQMALANSATMNSAGLKKHKQVSDEANAVIAQKIEEQATLTAEGRAEYEASLEPYARGMLKAAKLPMAAKQFLDSSKSAATSGSPAGLMGLAGKARGAAFVARNIPSFVRAVGSTFRQVTTYAKKVQVPLPAEATDALGALDTSDAEAESSVPIAQNEPSPESAVDHDPGAAPEGFVTSEDAGGPRALPSEPAAPAASVARDDRGTQLVPEPASEPPGPAPAHPEPEAGGAVAVKTPAPRMATSVSRAEDHVATPSARRDATPGPGGSSRSSIESRMARASRSLAASDAGMTQEALLDDMHRAAARLQAALRRAEMVPLDEISARRERRDLIARATHALDESRVTARRGVALAELTARMDAYSESALDLADEGLAAATRQAAPLRLTGREEPWTAEEAVRVFRDAGTAALSVAGSLDDGGRSEVRMLVRAGEDLVPSLTGTRLSEDARRAQLRSLGGIVERLADHYQRGALHDPDVMPFRPAAVMPQGWAACEREHDGLAARRVRFVAPGSAHITLANTSASPRPYFAEMTFYDATGEPTGFATVETGDRPLAPGEVREVLAPLSPLRHDFWNVTRAYDLYLR